MDRSIRIPDDIVDRLLTGLDEAYRKHLSIGYPIPTDVDDKWAFPVFAQLQNMENFPVMGLQQQFIYYGAIVYDVTLTSLGNTSSMAFYLIAPKNLAEQPLPPPIAYPTRDESWEDEDE